MPEVVAAVVAADVIGIVMATARQDHRAMADVVVVAAVGAMARRDHQIVRPVHRRKNPDRPAWSRRRARPLS